MPKQYTQGQRQSKANYLKTVKTWTIRIQPEEAQIIEQAAQRAGQSRNEYVLQSIRERMNREQQSQSQSQHTAQPTQSQPERARESQSAQAE